VENLSTGRDRCWTVLCGGLGKGERGVEIKRAVRGEGRRMEVPFRDTGKVKTEKARSNGQSQRRRDVELG